MVKVEISKTVLDKNILVVLSRCARAFLEAGGGRGECALMEDKVYKANSIKEALNAIKQYVEIEIIY